MATELGYIVLPVSALKEQVTTVFDTLQDDKIVYVSYRGRIVAAFRPYTFIPEGVLALHVSPILNFAYKVTARGIGRGVPSQAVKDAADGLPWIVEKDGHIYGMLTPATAPRPSIIPDPAVVGYKAEAILDYQRRNPTASIDDLMAFEDKLNVPIGKDAIHQSWPMGKPTSSTAPLERSDAVSHELSDWRQSGSGVEDIVERLFSFLDQKITAFAAGTPMQRHNAASARLSVFDSERPEAASARLSVFYGERSEAAGRQVEARELYVSALIADVHPHVGVMWRLGNLARSVGRRAEAARWFRLSLACDTVEQWWVRFDPTAGAAPSARVNRTTQRPRPQRQNAVVEGPGPAD